MKIAIVHPAFGAWGGAESVVLWQAEGLRARGHEVVVMAAFFSERARSLFTRAHVPTRRLTFMDGRPWTRLQIGSRGVGLLPLADHVVRLERDAMRRGAAQLRAAVSGFDVVNVHNFPATWWVHEARESARGDFPRVVWYCEEPPRTLYPGLFDAADFTFTPDKSPLQTHDRAVGTAIERIACNSGYVCARVDAIYDRPDARCVYLGVPQLLASPAPVPRDGPLEAIMVTRLVEAKNVACAIRAVARVPGVRLRIAGTGPQQDALEQLIAAQGVSDRVALLGFVADADMPALYGSADTFVFLPIGEPFGLVLLEAAWAGLASITSDHGGPAEIVEHGETGWRVDPRSVDAVAEGLQQLRDDPRRTREMGVAARARVEERFRLERFVDDIEALLSED